MIVGFTSVLTPPSAGGQNEAARLRAPSFLALYVSTDYKPIREGIVEPFQKSYLTSRSIWKYLI